MKCDYDRIAFKVDPGIKYKFFMLCKGRRISMSEALNQFILRQLEASDRKTTIKKAGSNKE